jgi:glycosyltransferase involved in cell wall biosynthesis
MIEQMERLARTDRWSIDLYSQRVSQLNGLRDAPALSTNSDGSIVWHKVSDIPGPHLLKYLWWFLANHWSRWRDRRSGRVYPDLLYSPGINCFDADVIVVHIVFHALYQRVRSELVLSHKSIRSWPRLIHRKLYYRLLMFLESKIYRNPRARLIAVSTLIARKLEAYFGVSGVTVISNAVDTHRFTPQSRRAKREDSRKGLGIREDEFVILLIGNDWKNKGLEVLLHAIALLRDLPIRLLIVGEDAPERYAKFVQSMRLQKVIDFLLPSPDVLQFYAAADLYAGPSMEDSFGLPIAEAMACGLPVIASVNAGASELIRHGENGMLLQKCTDARELASLIGTIVSEPDLRERLALLAASTIRAACSWDQNAAQTREFLENALRSKKERRD